MGREWSELTILTRQGRAGDKFQKNINWKKYIEMIV